MSLNITEESVVVASGQTVLTAPSKKGWKEETEEEDSDTKSNLELLKKIEEKAKNASPIDFLL